MLSALTSPIRAVFKPSQAVVKEKKYVNFIETDSKIRQQTTNFLFGKVFYAASCVFLGIYFVNLVGVKTENVDAQKITDDLIYKIDEHNTPLTQYGMFYALYVVGIPQALSWLMFMSKNDINKDMDFSNVANLQLSVEKIKGKLNNYQKNVLGKQYKQLNLWISHGPIATLTYYLMVLVDSLGSDSLSDSFSYVSKAMSYTTTVSYNFFAMFSLVRFYRVFSLGLTYIPLVKTYIAPTIAKIPPIAVICTEATNIVLTKYTPRDEKGQAHNPLSDSLKQIKDFGNHMNKAQQALGFFRSLRSGVSQVSYLHVLILGLLMSFVIG